MSNISVSSTENDSSIQDNGGWLKWCPTSAAALQRAERKLLSYLKQPFKVSYVSINSICEEKEKPKIHMLSMNTEAKNKEIPLVMLHGFASGIGLWVLNLDSLSENRPLYVFDILGFGRSSRPTFSKEASEVENQLVRSIEEWREQMGLQKFILLGHSMGGFLAASYALQHPDKVSHLILAEPWGFPERPPNGVPTFQPPLWVKAIATMLQPFNLLAGLRVAGPWGPGLVERFRPGLVRKFSSVVEDSEAIRDYIYHCNAQIPSGEAAFKVLTSHFGWAKYPMMNRIGQLKRDIPITFIYGSESWIDWKSGAKVKETRKDSYVKVKLIQGAGHHVYADNAEEFNSLVQSACSRVSKTFSQSGGLLHSNSCLERESAMIEPLPKEVLSATEYEDRENT